MADNEYIIPECLRKALGEAGYRADMSMAEHIAEWWSWFTADNDWYDGTRKVDGKSIRHHRMSLHPARRVCREWVSVILDDEGTSATASDEASNDVLHRWMRRTRFVTIAQRAMERAFALGTGAIALWFDDDGETVTVKPRSYDARMVVPLSWDNDGVTECAFCTRAHVAGKPVDQLQMHVLRPGDDGRATYHVLTRMFHDGKPYSAPGVLADYDTGTALPTFCILKPNIDNVYVDMSPYGQSVFADAIDVVKAVDESFDTFCRELDASKIKTFMSDELFTVDAKGNPRPMSWDASVIHMVAGHDVGNMIQTFAPPMRIDPIERAVNLALSQLGDQTGFGPQYFRFDPAGAVKTAFEVSSDNSAFARNIVKHENLLRPALEGILSAVLDCLRLHGGEPVEEGATVDVDFDDSVIQDTDSERRLALAEMAGMPDVPALKVDYLVRYKGFTREEAEAALPTAVEVDGGY